MSIATEESGQETVRSHPKPARLGEELPIFCERCGYSLHGLPQARCEHCTILQFHCPECGHHQAINTLRPAFQTMLGRVRAFFLVGSVVARIAFFALMLFAWFGMGNAWSYRYNPEAYMQSGSNSANSNGYTQVAPDHIPHPLRAETFWAFGIFGFVFSVVARMMLLRWRYGVPIGLTLAALVFGAVMLGAYVQWVDSFDEKFRYDSPYTRAFLGVSAFGAGVIVLGASIVWPIWCGLVKAFLPQRAASALLAWQRSMSQPASAGHVVADLARPAYDSQPGDGRSP